MVSGDVTIEVWDHARTSRVWVGDPDHLTVTPRHNQQPTAALTLAVDHRRAANLRTAGARVVITYRDEHLLSGPVRGIRTTGPGPARAETFEIEDDWRLLRRLLAWPVPAQPITNQGGAEHHVITGPAETVAKTLLGAAITRTGAPITVATDQGRGDTIEVRARMVPPADVLLPRLDQAGIGLTVRQVGAGLVLDAYEPTTWPGLLSEASGTLAESPQWSRTAPTTTRVVLGADGEGTARTFRSKVDTALEAQWGDVIETWIEARDLKSSDAGFEAAATARMDEALAAGAPRSSLSVKLAEAGRFRYGGPGGVHVGDVVRVELTPGAAPISDVLRSATLTWDRAGVHVTPVIGERTDDPSAMTARAIAAAQRAIRTLQRR